jgi:hypothetical protein
MSDKMADILAACLEAMEKENLSRAEVLARYPQYAAELESLLAAADGLMHAASASPSLSFKLHARQRLLKRLALEAVPRVTLLQRFRIPPRNQTRLSGQRRFAMSWIVALALAISLVFGGGAGVAYAADGAAPGDALYGIDKAVESLRLAMAFSNETKARLALEFATERLEELEELFAEGAPVGPLQLALQGYQASLQYAEQIMAQVMAGADASQGQSLSVMLQEQLQIHEQLLNQLRSQASTQNMAQVEEALRIMETARTRMQETLSTGPGQPAGGEQGEPGGQGEPQEGQGGSGGSGEPSGQGQAGEDAGVGPGGFEDGMARVEFSLQNMEALAAQGEWDQVRNQAQEYGAWVDELTDLAAQASEGNTAAAQALALMLEDHTARLNSLLANAPEDARTTLNQALTAARSGLDFLFGRFGIGPQGGAGGPTGEAGQGEGGSKGK